MEWYLVVNICEWFTVMILNILGIRKYARFASDYNLFIDLWGKQTKVNQILYDNQIKLESEILELKKEKDNEKQ